MLAVEIGAPVLEGERTYLDDTGHPVFFTITFYRADRHGFAFTFRDWRVGGRSGVPVLAPPGPPVSGPSGDWEDHE
jgi:hypothetical protein